MGLGEGLLGTEIINSAFKMKRFHCILPRRKQGAAPENRLRALSFAARPFKHLCCDCSELRSMCRVLKVTTG